MTAKSWMAGGMVTLMLSGCASAGGGAPLSIGNPLASKASEAQWTPTVDTQGVNETRYSKDLDECRAYAVANPDANVGKAQTKHAVRGGLVGAGVVGALVVATGGLALLPVAAGAMATTGAVGAGVGAVGGGMAADAAYKKTVNSCLTGRGYKIIG